MSKTQLNVRFAIEKDIEACISFDHSKKRGIISNKIEMKEIIGIKSLHLNSWSQELHLLLPM